MSCLTPWESTIPVYLEIYGCCRQQFLSSLAMNVLALITSSERRGWDSVSAHVQLSRVYLASTLDVTHMIKCTRLSPSLVGNEASVKIYPVSLWKLAPSPILLGNCINRVEDPSVWEVGLIAVTDVAVRVGVFLGLESWMKEFCWISTILATNHAMFIIYSSCE